MRYRRLGHTGLDISVIGFGASPLGNVFGDVSPQAATEAVRRALDLGINLFDVSPYYGLTLAEERLGTALEGLRDQAVLATKCGRYGASTFDFSAETITKEFGNSLRRLRTDHVDLLQVHDIEFGNIDLILNDTLPAMDKLRQAGKVRFIGITSYWPGLLARVAQQFPLDTILNYCHANLFINDMDAELTPLAQQKGTGLMNASPMHMGLLGGGPVPEWHPAPTKVREAARDVVTLCERHGVKPSTVALHACLQHPAVSSTFVGIQSAQQVDENCAALDWPPDTELLRAIHDRIAPAYNITWSSGLPENMDPQP